MSRPPHPAVQQFFDERHADIIRMGEDEELKRKSIEWMVHADRYKYTYNFTWMGRPIIKFPTDMVIQQELMWRLKPDLIIETGIAHGGSIIFSASMQQMIGIENGRVVAVDIDIREHNRQEIDAHPMSKHITMIEGSSVDAGVFARVKELAAGARTVMVILDSNHTHQHVYEELKLYANLVTVGSYCILPDTFIEFFPKGYYHNRPWDVGDNPCTAARQFLAERDDFELDQFLTAKGMISEGLDGYLKRVR
ncbi:MAG: CmcI family methyltransferase [Prosthecobacter sp.]|uniref:cephalosporin hydroxylase family protein n=1 Tax=Prosthecobacter sp. TaxID=1965333 RepID=UPI003BAF51CA